MTPGHVEPGPATPEEYLSGRPLALELFRLVARQIEGIGPATARVSKSQIALRRRRNFALLWTPDRYLRRETAPLVLTVLLRRRDDSSRWKQVVEPAPGRFTHHLELYDPAEIDEQVRAWLREAWGAAG